MLSEYFEYFEYIKYSEVPTVQWVLRCGGWSDGHHGKISQIIPSKPNNSIKLFSYQVYRVCITLYSWLNRVFSLHKYK